MIELYELFVAKPESEKQFKDRLSSALSNEAVEIVDTMKADRAEREERLQLAWEFRTIVDNMKEDVSVVQIANRIAEALDLDEFGLDDLDDINNGKAYHLTIEQLKKINKVLS